MSTSEASEPLRPSGAVAWAAQLVFVGRDLEAMDRRVQLIGDLVQVVPEHRPDFLEAGVDYHPGSVEVGDDGVKQVPDDGVRPPALPNGALGDRGWPYRIIDQDKWAELMSNAGVTFVPLGSGTLRLQADRVHDAASFLGGVGFRDVGDGVPPPEDHLRERLLLQGPHRSARHRCNIGDRVTEWSAIAASQSAIDMYSEVLWPPVFAERPRSRRGLRDRS